MPETALGLPYPDSTDAPNVPADIEALADAVTTVLTLPATVTAFVAGNITVVSTSMATLPAPGPCSVSITNPSSEYNMEVDVRFGAWVASATTGTQLQAGVAASGGVSFAADSLGSGGAVVNGEIILTQNVDGHSARSGFPVIIPAGAAAVTFTVHAKRSAVVAGSHIFNQPFLRVMPRRFLVP